MAKYRAKAVLYVGGRLIQTGEVFEADGQPGDKWESLEAKSGKDETGDTSAIEIPKDWRDLSAAKRISLAHQLGAPAKGTNADKADEVIEAEVARRAA